MTKRTPDELAARERVFFKLKECLVELQAFGNTYQGIRSNVVSACRLLVTDRKRLNSEIYAIVNPRRFGRWANTNVTAAGEILDTPNEGEEPEVESPDEVEITDADLVDVAIIPEKQRGRRKKVNNLEPGCCGND